MRFKIFTFTLLTLVANASLLAQTDHAWIGTGKVRARITPTGIHRDTEGGFLLESGIPGQPAKNLLSHLTPWVGGIDPGNNLKLACEMDNPLVSDWQAGFRGVPNSGKVWKVTIEQIAAHIKDYEDNGIVDNPIPEIFAWPGFGNPFSEDYNGFSTDSLYTLARPPFYNNSADGTYNPDQGDYPGRPELGSFPKYPKEMVFAPFYDNGENNLTHAKGIDLDAHLFAFTLDCHGQDFLENTIFFEFGRYYNSGVDRLDSLFWGIYADFDIGNPDDDYLGCVNEDKREMVFCYNSDTLNDNIIGANPPTLALMSLKGPFDVDFNPIQMSNVGMFFNNQGGGTGNPTSPNQFFNYLTGTWADGTPITNGGTGYNPGMPSATPTKFLFTDDPTDPNGWSELAENNPHRNRSCVVSYGPTVLNSHYISYPLKFALTVSDKVGLTEQLQHFTEMRDLQQYIYHYCWDCPNPLDSLCINPVAVKEIEPITRIAPNPTHDFISLQTPKIDIEDIIMVNALGQMVSIEPSHFVNEHEATITISLKNLPVGVYFLQWFSKDGQHGCEKVVKN
ncbi:MAG: T9SS type A sorting domain-containing protein [Phycisphaerae bacterium]|nr:T9SS type A sorting domain-containing protein [Saprospiraceae bacterium]